MTLRLDDDTRARYRKALLRKGKAIADELADFLAGKRGRGLLRTNLLPRSAHKPGMRPEERLRAYLEHVESRRRLLDAGDDRFGRCDVCGDDLGPAVLDQMPWADVCQACAAEFATPPTP
ncbi:hypothetical protein [Haliangium sp.]|uniref:hypothetical protein n=1 Tax=Haliangium sp. TaxID=2663208 RepID=UPI003D0F7EAE